MSNDVLPELEDLVQPIPRATGAWVALDAQFEASGFGLESFEKDENMVEISIDRATGRVVRKFKS
jgi:hypothetical protein